jgi:integrase
MATLTRRRRKDGTNAYRVQWRLGGGDGPWQSETFDDRRAAAKFQAQVEANGHLWPDGWAKGWGFRTPPTLPEEPTADVLLDFGTAYVRRLTSVGPDTQSTYLSQIKSLARWLRELNGVEPTLQSFTTDDDRDWINARRRSGASPKTIANYHGLLAAIFTDAVRKGLILRNPCEGVRLPRRDDDIDDDEDKVILTEDEFTVVHECLDADSRDLVTVDVGTGLRWGEISALKVKDLDLEADVPTLRVRRAWKRNGTGEFALADRGRFYLDKPKTKESRRIITLAPSIVETLRRNIEGKGPEDFVFVAPRGGRLDQAHWFEGRWQRAIAKAQESGLSKRPRFHDLRHTHAAWLISAGVPLPVIQKRLGHKSIQITVDVYGGLLFQTHEVADIAVERALRGKPILAATKPGSMHAGQQLDEEDSA